MYERKHYQQTHIYVWGVLVSDSSVSSNSVSFMYECKHYQQTYIYVWGVLVSDSSVSSLCALGGPNYKHLFSNCLIAEHNKEKMKANEVEQKILEARNILPGVSSSNGRCVPYLPLPNICFSRSVQTPLAKCLVSHISVVSQGTRD